MKTTTLILIVFMVLILITITLAVIDTKNYNDKIKKQNVYEYLSNGRFSAPLTSEEIQILEKEYEVRQIAREDKR